jgi:hypothetical protein
MIRKTGVPQLSSPKLSSASIFGGLFLYVIDDQ